MREQLMKRLDAVLARERAALIDAEFAILSDLAQEKESLLQSLTEISLSSSEVQAITDQINRNHALTGAALKGVNAARSVVTGRKENASGSIVYGRNGEVSRMSSQVKNLSQKL